MAAEPALSARRAVLDHEGEASRVWRPALTPRFTLGKYALAARLYWASLTAAVICALVLGGMLYLIGSTGDPGLLPYVMAAVLAFAIAGGAATFCHQMRKGHRRIVAKYEYRPRHAAH